MQKTKKRKENDSIQYLFMINETRKRRKLTQNNREHLIYKKAYSQYQLKGQSFPCKQGSHHFYSNVLDIATRQEKELKGIKIDLIWLLLPDTGQVRSRAGTEARKPGQYPPHYHHHFPAADLTGLGFLGKSDSRQKQAQGGSRRKGQVKAAPPPTLS